MWKKGSFWWVVALIWCLVIAYATRTPFFTGSSTEELLRNPFFDSFIFNIVIRKTGHLVAFGLLACFFWLALKGKRFIYFNAWVLATSYGAIDEWHQSFIPARDGRVIDVVVNSCGAFLALLCIYLFLKIKDRVKKG